MNHWYPTQARIAQLDAAAFEPPNDAGITVPDYSEVLRTARKQDWFPAHQTHRWVWLASQYRLHRGSGGDAEKTSQRALEYLRSLGACSAPTDDQHRDLRWMLDTSVRRLAPMVGAAQIRSCLSTEERAAVELKLASYDTGAFDGVHTRRAVAAQLASISEIVGGTYLSSFTAKVEALFGAAENGCPHSRAALAYLAEHEDAVPDSGGFLGLVDDVYVVEWAYAASLHETRCLPILEGLLQRFPHVADVPLIGAPPRPLGAYAQYAVVAALQALFDEGGAHVISLREAGPTPLLASVFAAIECVRSHAQDLDREITDWPPGTHMTLSDGLSTLRVTFEGLMDVGGKQRIQIGVRNGAGVSGRGKKLVQRDILPYVAKAQPFQDKLLAKGGDVDEWLRTRHADPFVNVLGSARKALERRRCAMYVGPRWKLDAYIHLIKPMDGAASARLGIRHALTKTKFEEHTGSVTDAPFLYTCCDASVAAALVSDPPEQVESWSIVIDGADLGDALNNALAAAGNAAEAPRCTFAELHDREGAASLLVAAPPSLVLEDHDVQPSASGPWRASTNDDELVRGLDRQPNYWTAAHEFVECSRPSFEALADAVRVLRASGDDDTRHLELAVSALMRRALAAPIAPCPYAEKLPALAAQALTLAAPMRRFSEAARVLYNALQAPDISAGTFCDRMGVIRPVAATVRAGERLAILCRTQAIAEIYRAQFRDDVVLGQVNWTTLQTIRRNAPLERIVVPGWFDKSAIRELALAGYAELTTFLFFPFERDWFNATLAAQHRWERRLDAVAAPRLQKLAEKSGASGGTSRLWRPQTQLRVAAGADPQTAHYDDADEDDADHDWIERRAVAALEAAVPRAPRSADSIRAQLIVFDGGAEYICLPPASEVIVLSGRDDRGRESGSTKNAEDYLYSTVSELKRGMVLAFPTGGDRDLLDARADEFIPRVEETRALAALWKSALKRTLIGPIDPWAEAFAKRITEAGQPRKPFTVRAWVTHTGTVAPRNYRVLVPLIAKLTNDMELHAAIDAALAAIDLVYRGRAKAADAIVQELFAGDIDTDAEELRFDIGEHQLRFSLRRVLSVRAPHFIHADYIGRLSTFAAGAQL